MTRPFTKDTHVIPIETIAAGTLQTSDGRPVYAISNYTTAPTDGRPLRAVTPTNPNNGTPVIACSLYAQGTLMTADGRPVYAVTGASPYTDSTYSLALDFASASYWASGTNYAALSSFPGYTYTRTGIQGAVDASGAVAFYAANTPAINSAGYHAYGALTNSITYSQDITAADWGPTATTRTANTWTAPDGTLTGDRLTGNAGTTAKYIASNSFTANNGETRTFSTFVYYDGTHRYVQMLPSNISPYPASTYANYDLQTGTVAATGAGAVAAYIVSLGNNIYRLVLVATATATNTSIYYLAFVDTAGAGALAASASTGNINPWQTQSIIGNFPDGGPVIATAGATAAIGEGLMEVTDTVGADADQLFIVKGALRAGPPNGQLADWNDNTDANSVAIVLNGASISGYVAAASVAQYFLGIAYTHGTDVTAVIRRLGGNWRFGVISGGAITWAASGAGSFPAGLTQVNPAAYRTAGFPASDQEQFVGRRLGTFTTDAEVIAAVAGI